MNVRIRMVPVPYAVAKGTLALFKLIAPMFVGKRFNSVTSASLDFISRNNPFTSSLARIDAPA